MRTSIATVCLSGLLEDKLVACAEAGFDGVEIFEQDLVVSRHSPEEIRALADRLGLSLDLYQPFRDLEGVSDDRFAANLRRAEAKFVLMNRLGIDTMLLCSNVGTATVDDDEVVAEQLRALGDLAARHGIRVAYEALAWGRFVDTYRHSWDIVRRADHPAVGLCLDSFHILSRGDDPSHIADIDGSRIFFVQLADAPVLTMDTLSWSRHHRSFPGEGDFDLTGFTLSLLRSGYDGPLSLEIFNDVFRQSDPTATAIDAMRSLRWLQQRVRGAATAEDSAFDALLTPIAKIDPPSDVDYVEIHTAAPETVAQQVAHLGFTFVGQHRRKQSQLWERGDARVLVTPRATAPTTRIGGIAVRVDDTDVAARRADDLCAERVPRQATADEAALPGVYAPDGTEVFFTSASSGWTDEFRTGATESSAPAERDAMRVDHVALPQSWTAFDQGLLFFESLFRMTVGAPVEIPGPTGLVRSQILETPDAHIRIGLTLAPQTHGRGSPEGPGHIAFATDDVVGTARAARAAGMRFLAVPANYYDDLAARFDLDADLLATLRSLDLLYDRDDAGEFLHFYTHTIGDVFFEVVERRGDYRGYAASNAPVRLAARQQEARRCPTP